MALEAWAGVPAQGALARRARSCATWPPSRRPARARCPTSGEEHGALVEALTFLMTVIAIACWAAPLAASAGADVVERAVMLALPVTLGLQWGLSGRYFSREQGRSALARHRATLALAAGGLAALGWLWLEQAGLIAALLTITWVGGDRSSSAATARGCTAPASCSPRARWWPGPTRPRRSRPSRPPSCWPPS